MTPQIHSILASDGPRQWNRIENMEKLATVLYKTSTNIEFQISNELSSLKAIDFHGTISSENPLGMHQKNLVHNLYTTLLQMRYILI